MSVEALLGHRRRVRRAVPARPAPPGPDRGRRELRDLLRDPGSSAAPRERHKVQDPYSLRCVPQVHGAVRDALDHLRRVLDIELNARPTTRSSSRGARRADDAVATGGGR
jgi:histidine ammonia-lyase